MNVDGVGGVTHACYTMGCPGEKKAAHHHLYPAPAGKNASWNKMHLVNVFSSCGDDIPDCHQLHVVRTLAIARFPKGKHFAIQEEK